MEQNEQQGSIRQAMDNIRDSLNSIEKELIQLENQRTDSIELGSPSKGGKIKVYGNASDPQAFREKIENIINLKYYAEVYDEQTGNPDPKDPGDDDE